MQETGICVQYTYWQYAILLVFDFRPQEATLFLRQMTSTRHLSRTKSKENARKYSVSFFPIFFLLIFLLSRHELWCERNWPLRNKRFFGIQIRPGTRRWRKGLQNTTGRHVQVQWPAHLCPKKFPHTESGKISSSSLPELFPWESDKFGAKGSFAEFSSSLVKSWFQVRLERLISSPFGSPGCIE